MIYSQADLLKRLYDTHAVSIWNRETGPIYWYAASVPGPFYVNTELVIGADLSASLLQDINAILAETPDAQERAEKLEKLVLDAFDDDKTYRNIIETMVAHAREVFAPGTFTLISGGERRDWLFSIPFAKLMGIKHLYLFKNDQSYCEDNVKAGETALHVADLINNAASYFDHWLPALEQAGVRCMGTLCVNSRGANGVERLKAEGIQVVALNSIDIAFFEQWLEEELIDAETLEEMRVYFKSAKEWASAYLMDKPHLFETANVDSKSFARLEGFFTKDPWGLRPKHEAFFVLMENAIAERRETIRVAS